MILLSPNPKQNGYAWNGCSPESFFLDIYFGTPNGVIAAYKPKTYDASLVYDVLYQFCNEYRGQVSRKSTDLIFLRKPRRRNFRLGGLNYFVLMPVGWVYRQDIIRMHSLTRYIFLVVFLGLLRLLFFRLTSLCRWRFLGHQKLTYIHTEASVILTSIFLAH